MKIGQVYSRPVVTTPPSSTLADVAALMRDHHIGAVVVTKATLDRPIPIGMITDRDIVHAQLDHTADLSRLRAEDVMTSDPLVLNIEVPVSEAIQRLHARGVRRAPVIDATGALAGIVSTDDLIGQVAQELSALARLVTEQPRKETAASSAS